MLSVFCFGYSPKGPGAAGRALKVLSGSAGKGLKKPVLRQALEVWQLLKNLPGLA